MECVLLTSTNVSDPRKLAKPSSGPSVKAGTVKRKLQSPIPPPRCLQPETVPLLTPLTEIS